MPVWSQGNAKLDDPPQEGPWAAADARDRALVIAAQTGSPEAVEAVIRRFWPDAHRIAIGVLGNAATAEDVAQDALLTVVDQLPSFDPSRPFRPWLYRITTNRALDYLRRQTRRPEVSIDAVAPSPQHDPALAFVDEGLQPLMALEPPARAALVLRFLVGLNSEQIGQVLGLKPGSVRSLIHRSQDKLSKEPGT